MTHIKIDPIQLAALEVGWWKAHHEHNKEKMTELLIQQNVVLYGFTSSEAQVALQELVLGIRYHDTREWNKAVDAVTLYYQKIKDKTGLSFIPREVAELEVAWWQMHDKLEHIVDKKPLANLFTKLYATEFGIPEAKLAKAGELKAQATHEHDLAEDHTTPPEEVNMHWEKAEKLLINFYEELKASLVLEQNQY